MKTKKCNKCNIEKPLEEMVKVSKITEEYTSICKICESNRKKDYRQKNKIELNKQEKVYRNNKSDDTKNKRKIYEKEYRKINRIKINGYFRKRKKEDPLFKLSINIRTLIGNSFRNKGVRKNSKTALILGCSIQEFKEYLETNFEIWMNWDNYGKYNGELNHGWDIDHKIPLKTAVTEEELTRLSNHTNLQPLCSYLNRDIKRDNL
jgi:hypothetical protein